MKRSLLTGVLVLAALCLAGAQQGFAYSTLEGGCLTCHTTFAGGSSSALHTKHSSAGCTACHPTSTPGSKPIASSKCIVCHPRTGGTGECKLVNLSSHATASPSCISCHASRGCTSTDNTTDNCTDNDKDGYGENCTLGPDCDDTDNTTHDNCTEPLVCDLKVTPKRFSQLTALLMPVQFFAIRPDTGSDASFENPICIYWESEGIDDILSLRLGNKMIFGLIRVWAGHLDPGKFSVTVTYGDPGEQRCGPIEVR